MATGIYIYAKIIIFASEKTLPSADGFAVSPAYLPVDAYK
jgi:hypothetical protein